MDEPTPTPTPANGRSKRDQLQMLLSRKARITVTDGRVFQGFFVCVDRDANVVLNATEEFDGEQLRYVGAVVIRGCYIATAKIESY